VCAAAAALWVLSVPASAGTLTGLCIAVPDGDTIVVRDGNRRRFEVRLQGIDAPEKGQRFGSLARRSLTSLVYRKQVEVDWSKQDKYGRLVGRVYVGDIDVNLSQADAGMAWAYREFLHEMSARDQKLFLDAERGARDERRGLWRDANPTPPWDWRHRQQRAGAARGQLLGGGVDVCSVRSSGVSCVACAWCSRQARSRKARPSHAASTPIGTAISSGHSASTTARSVSSSPALSMMPASEWPSTRRLVSAAPTVLPIRSALAAARLALPRTGLA
jgi:endonuclease YncB( thermonuclease family)